MKRNFLFIIFFYIFSQLFAQTFEAEESNCFGVTVKSEENDFSGTGYVTFSKYIQNYITFEVEITEETDYMISLVVKNPFKDKRASCKIMLDNEVYICAQRLPFCENFTKVYVNTPVHLTKNNHTVYVYGISGGWQLDFVSVEKITDELKNSFLFPSKLVTENPSKETVAVYDYLCSMQGKGILSGQQMDKGSVEINAIKNVTGKIPAVLGIDLIDFSPSRVERGTTSRVISEAKKFWEAGGIITCCWHWNAPMDLIDEGPDKYWYSGFYTKATKYNFVKALRDHESQEYKLMIRDIDAIAVQLKLLQEAKVPVLWRPLHEASGGWFWWGASGAENYIELYKLLFNRLQNYHGLNNLIWVWNGQNADWYPGDEYVDIISYDSYPGRYKHTAVESELEKIQAATFERKIPAISENGSLPDINKLAEINSPWAWFCTWNGNFAVKGRAYSEDYTKLDDFKRFYENEYLITQDELPNFKQ